MNSQPTDWIRWLGTLTSESDTVSRQVIDRWTEWFNGVQSGDADDGFSAWRDVVPGSIVTLSTMIGQVRSWVMGDAPAPPGVDMASIQRRLEVLERELARLKADARAGEDGASGDL
tara:strand:- start:468 stop:815 length:348 start_codon:yes stop_codon:yes gene_type:complete